ncbi:MAG: hypothetical protein HQ475_11565 [SAR202 cluster bacterium]|nr:hypothetical protein [SAR202 cluster bacterium]
MNPFVDEVYRRFLEVYRANLKRLLQVAADMDDDEYRLELAKSEPDKAHILEGQTRQEREAHAPEIAMSVAVADAIQFALEKHHS